MYDWIPMEFDLEFINVDGIKRKYFVRANGIPKRYFTTFNEYGEIGNNSYTIDALMHPMEHCEGTINGMTLAALTGTPDDDEIDISSLI